MKATLAVLVALVFSTRDVLAYRHGHYQRAQAKQPVPPVGLTEDTEVPPPAAAPIVGSPSPADPNPNLAAITGAAVSDIELSFELKNYNYYDLEKKRLDGVADDEDKDEEDEDEEKEGGDSFFQVTDSEGTMENVGETVAAAIASVFTKIIKKGLEKLSKEAPIAGSSQPLIAAGFGSSMPAGIVGSSMPLGTPLVGSSMPLDAPIIGSSMPLNPPIAGQAGAISLLAVAAAPAAAAVTAGAPAAAAMTAAAPAAAAMPAAIAGAPASAPPAAAIIAGAPSAAPPAEMRTAAVVDHVTGQATGMVNPSEEQVNVFVTFKPGPRMKVPVESFLQTAPAEPAARTTIVDVMITDKPQTGANLLPAVRSIIMQSQADGHLMRRLEAALFQSTGLAPAIAGLAAPPATAEIKQWEEGNCEKHMKKLVQLMEVAYTRRMVPLALFNECTNFIPSLTFSHDPVATRLDRKKCRTATIKFAQRWDYGKASWNHGAGAGHEPMDFTAFCRDVCHTRFGDEAPQCNVNQQIQKGV